LQLLGAVWQGASNADREQRAEDTAIVAGQKLAMYSPSWAAPEQLAGQQGPADDREHRRGLAPPPP